jgi:hypothetical protein
MDATNTVPATKTDSDLTGSRGGIELVKARRAALAANRPWTFPDSASRMAYLKGVAKVQIKNGSR